MKKFEFIPAVLPETFQDIDDLVHRVGKNASLIQIDICDGKYVDSRTWPYLKGELTTFNDDFELPGWEYLDYELDLMIQSPELHIENLKNLGAKRMIIHLESTDIPGIISAIELLKKYDIEVGLGIRTTTDKNKIEEASKYLDESSTPYYFQVMGIETIGKQGESFSEKSLETISYLKSKHTDIDVQVDGGMNDETVTSAAKAGAERFVFGSYLSKGYGSVQEKINILKNLLY